MNDIRKDSWTQEQDSLLAEIVLRHVSEGSTQLKAFEEAAERLERTTSACGFRWNSVVRKEHEEALKEAKNGRGKRKVDLVIEDATEDDLKEKYDEIDEEPSAKVASTRKSARLNDVVEELQKHSQIEFDATETLDKVKSYIAHLESENKRLTDEIERLKADKPQEDLSSLLAILDRARGIVSNIG